MARLTDSRRVVRRLVFFAVPVAALLWASQARAQVPQSEYAARRAALASLLDDGTVIAFGSAEPEQDYLSFFQNSRFRYLTGFREPDAVLVFQVRGKQIAGEPMLFVQPKDPAQEVWAGVRLGPDSVRRLTGMAGRPVSTFRPVVDSLILAAQAGPRTGNAPPPALHIVGDFSASAEVLSRDDQIVRAIAVTLGDIPVRSANAGVDRLRRVKSGAELELIRKAVDITVSAQREAMRFTKPGVNEYEIQALVEYTFRRNGAERPSFATIIGSGPNSTTLHYNANDRPIDADDVIVMDIGASYAGYAADVTRTIPSSGVFSPAQRAIYQAVRDAQAAAERQAVLNADSRLMSDAATASLNVSLARLGLIEAAGATYDCNAAGTTQCAQHTLYYMHGLGHGIGLDVHDPGASGGRLGGQLVPGSAFTIEPGIYVRSNLLQIIPRTPRNLAMIQRIRPAVQRYAEIGVRIEDDYIVTDSGVEWISRAPREIEEIEALMRQGAR